MRFGERTFLNQVGLNTLLTPRYRTETVTHPDRTFTDHLAVDFMLKPVTSVCESAA